MTAREVAEFLKRLEKGEVSGDELELSEDFPSGTTPAHIILNVVGLEESGQFPSIEEMTEAIEAALEKHDSTASYVRKTKPAHIKADLWLKFDFQKADINVHIP
ncbi:MAG: hypothetical protein ABEJ72_07535 [Candidatus Aenigmatarchaeota archaeon]